MSRCTSIVVAVVGVLLADTAAGQSVCVDCKGPDRSYSCTVKEADRAKGIRGAGRAIEVLCISEIARTGGHDSCRVNTSYAGPCIGQPHEVDLAKAAEVPVQIQPADKGAAKEAEPGEATPGLEVPAGRKGPPQTLEELARDTMAKSKQQIDEADRSMRKAGDAVGGAVKQSWECLISLFKRC